MKEGVWSSQDVGFGTELEGKMSNPKMKIPVNAQEFHMYNLQESLIQLP